MKQIVNQKIDQYKDSDPDKAKDWQNAGLVLDMLAGGLSSPGDGLGIIAGAAMAAANGGEDMKEFGKLIIEDLSDDIFFNKFLNISLSRFNLVYSKRNLINVGVCFYFVNNTVLYILNLGDELFFYDELPRAIELEEGLILIDDFFI